MGRVIHLCAEAAVASIVLIPLFLFLDRRRFHNRKRTILYCILAVYLSAMYAVVGLPDIRYIRFQPHFNFVPFAYMFSDYKNSLLNVLLFMPLGFLLPVLWARFQKATWTVLLGLGLSFLIEVLQIFTLRATDVNDLMTNTLGTFSGWCVARLMPARAIAVQPQESTRDLRLVFGITFLIMFLLHPLLSECIYRFFR